MSIQVKSIDVYKIEERLRKDKDLKDIWQYVKSLKIALDRQKELTNLAISKLKKSTTKLIESDCTCTGDQYGWAVNPNCIFHGKNR